MSEREIVREVNALTVMPLPVKIPVIWYEALPKVLPLLRWSTEHPRFFMAEEIIDVFINKWRKILIRQDGDFVWLHLGGVACYEVIPNFIKGVRDKIDSSDNEISSQGGIQAIVQHWRSCVEGMQDLEDQAVLDARAKILRLLDSEMWNDELGKSWSFAAERAHVNFGKIRPVIKRWIAKYEGRCNLDEPFGGRLSAARYPTPGGGVL
ncbi:MAG: hypothetical protein JSV02_06765 [Dehalococcoidia bacterium]|nr:MAG: hypothetical protein JSV02_06765 [Dehalococcoidia bacterium]